MIPKKLATLRRRSGCYSVSTSSLNCQRMCYNNEKMRATLDTGSSSTFNLTPEAVALLKLEAQAQPSGTTSVGYNGEYESQQGILKSVRLGRISVESVQAYFLLPKTGHDNRTFQVIIGNGFFQDFVMTFDFKNKMVVFERVD